MDRNFKSCQPGGANLLLEWPHLPISARQVTSGKTNEGRKEEGGRREGGRMGGGKEKNGRRMRREGEAGREAGRI